MSISHALQTAVARLRTTLGDPVAPIAVLTPSDANGVLARQQLALAGPFIRVDFLTPERLVRDLGRRTLAQRGLRPQPGAWLNATVGLLARDLTGPYAEVLTQPGWRTALARAIDTLEAAGVDPDALERVPVPEHAERLRILSTLLRGVRTRRGVDRLYAMADLCEAALPRVHHDRWAGAVLLGDRLLAPRVHDVVRAWLAARPHVEVLPPPWADLAPAPMGLRAASSGDVLPVAMEPAKTVLARTPDEVRELGEAARVVLDAIARGTPLDRIAVVLPDADQVTVLRGHLERAGVPATWLTGPPLASTPAASFLLHALGVAAGDDTVPAWYDLLRQPRLRLRAEKRGRWRRLLSRCGAVRDTPTILRALEGVEDAESLVAAIEALQAVFDGLKPPATLGEHARRWSRLLQDWWVPSPDREQVRGVLAGWGSPGIGAPVSLQDALAELQDALGSAPALEGSLSDPAVRVATPMTLLGGAFDVVVVTGLTEGRLPRRPDEDPLLPDALLAAINEALGTSLLGSRDLAGFETRRFAAIVGSCTKQLWLSAPATELLKERPLLPSTFLLDTASILLGRRAGFSDLAALQERCGSRARPWPEDPDRAVGALEHRIATTALDPRSGLRRLALHATARRLLGLHRALDAEDPTPWTGLLPPGIVDVPGMDGTPLSPWLLAELLNDPGAFFVSRVLGVRRTSRLYASSDPTMGWWMDKQLLDALAHALDDAGGDRRTAFETSWDSAIADWRRFRVDVSDADVDLVRALTMQRADGVWRALPTGDRQPVAGKPVADLPWTLEAEHGWVDGDVLGVLERRKPARKKLARDVPAVVMVGMVAPTVTRLRVTALDGRTESSGLAAEAAALTDALRGVTDEVARGVWPLRELQ